MSLLKTSNSAMKGVSELVMCTSTNARRELRIRFLLARPNGCEVWGLIKIAWVRKRSFTQWEELVIMGTPDPLLLRCRNLLVQLPVHSDLRSNLSPFIPSQNDDLKKLIPRSYSKSIDLSNQHWYIFYVFQGVVYPQRIPLSSHLLFYF